MNISFKDMETVLMRELRLYHHPIAVRLLPTEDALKEFSRNNPHVIPATKLTFCQWEIAARMAAQQHFRPAARDRRIPASLRAYAKLVSSADKGAVRIVEEE